MWESDLLHPLNDGALVGWEPFSCTVQSFVRWELWLLGGGERASISIGYFLDLRGPTGHSERIDVDALEPAQRQRLGSFIGRPIAGVQAGMSGRLTLDFVG